MEYAIKVTVLRTKKRIYYGDYNGKTVKFATKKDAEAVVEDKFPQKSLNAKVVKFLD